MLRNLLLIAIFTVFTVFAWIGFSVLHQLQTSTISKDTTIKIDPITPTFDRKTLEKLQTHKEQPADLNEKVIINPTGTQRSSTASSAARLNNGESTNVSSSATITP